MRYILRRGLFFCYIASFALIAEQSFVIKKEKKKKSSSIKALKEQYAKEAGQLIKVSPKLQKHIAQLQKVAIEDIDDLLNNTDGSRLKELTKEHLEVRANKLAHLTKQMELLDSQLKEVCLSFKKRTI